jgi:hypothetical protein
VQAALLVLLVEEAIKATVLVRWPRRHDYLKDFLFPKEILYKIFFQFFIN